MDHRRLRAQRQPIPASRNPQHGLCRPTPRSRRDNGPQPRLLPPNARPANPHPAPRRRLQQRLRRNQPNLQTRQLRLLQTRSLTSPYPHLRRRRSGRRSQRIQRRHGQQRLHDAQQRPHEKTPIHADQSQQKHLRKQTHRGPSQPTTPRRTAHATVHRQRHKLPLRIRSLQRRRTNGFLQPRLLPRLRRHAIREKTLPQRPPRSRPLRPSILHRATKRHPRTHSSNHPNRLLRIHSHDPLRLHPRHHL